MKILHITDSHGTVKGPESRRDIYYVTFLKKLYELGIIIKRNKIDMVIHTGDLFHTARVSDKFAGQVSELIKAWDVPVYVVPGNHDIEGYTTDTIDQTKLGLLAKTGVIHLLDRDNPILINAVQPPNGEVFTIAISGQEYYAHIDEGNAQDFEMQQDEADLNILAIHGYVTSTPQHPDIKCTMVQDIITDANIILTGHYHRQFEWHGADVDIYNPGSMMRVEQTEYNKTHMPQYGILDINLNANDEVEYDYTFHEFRIAQPSTTVFDYNAQYKVKSTSITLDGFKNSLASTMTTIQPSMGIVQIIDNICTAGNVDPTLHKLAVKTYSDTLQTIPDEFEVQQGFIEAHHDKKIVSVEIHNFQSHEDTVVTFDDGLNIIVGESNNGKTSIMRAIMWVIDNQPLGTDFIMAGKKDCYVKVKYSDGTSIERGRTLKDTGYYKIEYIDVNGVIQFAEYRGFTNAVPVEVANVHQMPKVNITKDIETHLNVLSQLDGPFLLTESPLTKASAIGRITGTHVIDAAIKDSNKTILSNGKLIKSYEADLQEKQNELASLPDVDKMDAFANMYTAIVESMKKLQEDVDKLSGYQVDIAVTGSKIAQEQSLLNNAKGMASLKKVAEIAFSKLQEVQQLHSKMDLHDSLTQQIAECQESVSHSKMIRSLLPIITRANELSSQVDYLYKSKQDYDTTCDSIAEIGIRIDTNGEYNEALKSIIVHCGLLESYISKAMPKIEEIDNISAQQQVAVNELAIHKKTAKNIKTQITKAQKDKNQFILGNGVCPCCGQPITDAHVDSVAAFMEG